jgi:transcriptional regulator with XRE-family HTH domain
MMISGAQIRVARGLLGWPRHELARRAVISDATLYALETARGMIANKSTLATVQATLEAAGIEFLVDSDAPGVRLHSKPRSPTAAENENPRQLPD